jgi:hypothetical protein
MKIKKNNGNTSKQKWRNKQFACHNLPSPFPKLVPGNDFR